jgi:hypothetical protein
VNFEIESSTPVKFSHLNIRDEKHGDESVPACDLTFLWATSNDVLAQFDGMLLHSLYGPPTAAADQGALDGVEPVSQFPTLRFPRMATITWDDKATGDLSIDYGLQGKPLELTTCKIHKFKIDCKEGGTVEIKFTVSCSAGLTEKTLGKLALLIGQQLDISITPSIDVADKPLHDRSQFTTVVTLFGADAAH